VVKLGINEEKYISQDGLEKIPLEIKRKFYYTACDQSDALGVYIYIIYVICMCKYARRLVVLRAEGAKKESKKKLATKMEMFR